MGCGGSKDDAAATPAVPLEVSAAKLHSAIRWERIQEVKDIVAQAPATVNVKDDSNGNTAIHIAAQNGHLELVTLLCKAGGDVDAQNAGGQTALHMVVTYELDKCIDFLTKSGANQEIKNLEGIPAKFGLGGEKDPNSLSSKMAAFKSAESEADLLKAMKMLNGQPADKAQVAQLGMQKKKANKDSWTDAVKAEFATLMGSLA